MWISQPIRRRTSIHPNPASSEPEPPQMKSPSPLQFIATVQGNLAGRYLINAPRTYHPDICDARNVIHDRGEQVSAFSVKQHTHLSNREQLYERTCTACTIDCRILRCACSHPCNNPITASWSSQNGRDALSQSNCYLHLGARNIWIATCFSLDFLKP